MVSSCLIFALYSRGVEIVFFNPRILPWYREGRYYTGDQLFCEIYFKSSRIDCDAPQITSNAFKYNVNVYQIGVAFARQNGSS